ncbi:CDP-glucose 4,6-dehydratase [Sphingomonas sp. KR1UV-12]|uniref:CDP-glucose 4,6-dehydratase n=1 Tax=Sphingomonas aurea TaxID=3063994 RepID=A0ABT9EPS8_9SPHN|nr:CDP-glucose 4,6-dehydratase [Sphingomonas sp. KR1UV-12]MDP1028798.1 CDP-glucose 4,6-dehydratase [Sphingomonas sp. KR1UV-12]
MDRGFWRGRRVFLTGHTGFKGGWLALWLADAGAEVHGFALPAPTEPSLFEAAGVVQCLAGHTLGDIRDADAVARALAAARPEIVFHLAAQPLVRLSYAQPLETFATNVMGTAHVLEAARAAGSVRALVSVTTDKCYENHEWPWPYRESDALGGHDPYSASKACAELVTAAWRTAYPGADAPRIASARAGNVIGGGDWALDRLVPDALRACDAGTVLAVRRPAAVRPWQHVLEPLAGYIRLAERLAEGDDVAQAWNFGPVDADARPVAWILDTLARTLPDLRWQATGADEGVHEAGLLKLDSSRARARLGWAPRWRLDEALAHTAAWHRAWCAGADMAGVTRDQIHTYEAAPRDGGADG